MAIVRLSSQHITHIIHIADLHVRCGNNETARVDEYEAVFNKFLEDIAELPAVIGGTAVCVIAGDIFETKTRAETAGGILLFSFLNKLQELLSIIIICGNHDFKQSEPDIPDSVDMITMPYRFGKETRVHYLKDTGHYIWGNIGFGLCSVKDTLRIHNTAGIVENLPEFPSADEFPEEVEYKTALFHGTISQSALPTGRSAETVAHGYPLDWFAGYDAVMLGDNHQQQIHTTPTGMHWGYPGSLVQQNFGEPLHGHGYILWDIASNEGTLHHVFNDRGAVTVVDDMVMLTPFKKVSFKEATELSYFPKSPRVRIVGDQDDAKFVQTYFLKYGVVPSYITLKGKHAYTTGSGDEGELSDTLGAQMNTLSDLNSPHYWKTFMNDQPEPIPVSEWIYEPSRMMLPSTYTVPSAILDAITIRNNKIQQLLQGYEKSANSPSVENHRIILKYMEWDNLMSFGGDNRFDFESMNHKIALLNGANATGKSSFLDVLCIAIYGEPTASRRDFSGTNISHKIMNDHKPLNASCGVTLVVSIDDAMYEIYRSFTNHSQDKDTIKTQIVVVYKYVDTPGEEYKSKEVVAEGTSVVNMWISKYFGTSEEILMSTILCQSDTTNFFFKTHAEQRHILDKALHLDTISSYVEVLDESIKAHKYMVDKVTSYREGMTDASDNELHELYASADELELLHAAADVAKAQARELQTSKDELLACIGDMKEIKKIAREYDDSIYDALKQQEAELQELGGHDGDEPAAILDARNLFIRLQVEQEDMLKTAAIPQSEFAVANKRALSTAKKELAAHLEKKPKTVSRFSRDHILAKKTEYTDWAKNAPVISCHDALDATRKLDISTALYEDMTEKYHKVKGYNLIEPTVKISDECDDISVEDAVQQYYNLGIGGLPQHSSEYYENIIVSWKASCPADWLSNADAKLKELRKSETDVNSAIDKQMSDDIYISKPTMKRPAAADCVVPAWSRARLDQLQTAVIPCRPAAGLTKWKQTLDEWKALPVPKETLEELERSLEYAKLKAEVDELAKIECNPDCHVCRKNPGVVRMKALEKKLAKLARHGAAANVRDRKTLERMIAVRRTYDERIEWMTTETAAWESAEADFERERQRLADLAVAWWSLWETWDSKLCDLKQERSAIRDEIESIAEHTRIYTQKHAEYVEATSNLEQAKAYDERMVAWNIAWHAVQRDICKYQEEIHTLSRQIEYLKQYIGWDKEMAELIKDETLLDAMESWTIRHDMLESRVAAEKWKQRWATLTVELAAARDAVVVYDNKDRLENTIGLYKRIIAYWKFEDLDEQLADAVTAAETAVKRYETVADKALRLKVHTEQVGAVDVTLRDLKSRLDTLVEFHRRFVGDKQHDGFKMWVYRTKVLPLIEQEVNRFIGYIDTFTLSIRIRKGTFIYMLQDRGSTPTLDHASGYQKFIVGLAMRVALSRIGAVGQNIKHIFIDEGFVACDASNMLKTKEIMDLMLRFGGYQSILLITHMDTIKDIAQMRVDVCRPEGTLTSYIRLGLKKKAVPKMKKVTVTNPVTNETTITTVIKKRGRPSKASLAAAK